MSALDKAGDKINDAVKETTKAGRSAAHDAALTGDSAGADVRSLLKDIEAALKEGKDDDAGALRARLEGRLSDARSAYDDAQLTIRQKLSAAASTTDGYVRERPWETVAAAAGLAFLFGIIIGRS